MHIVVYNSAGEIVKDLAYLGAYTFDIDYAIENSTFSPDDGGKAIIKFTDGRIVEWDGTNQQFKKVENGVYYIKVDIKDSYGYNHAIVKDVTVLTNSIKAQLKIFNSAGEVVKIIPVDGISQFGSNEIKVIYPESQKPFAPGEDGDTYAIINYMDKEIKWDGTNDFGLIVANGIYTIQLVQVDENAYKTIAETQITVLHNGYEIINNIRIIPNPVDMRKNSVLIFKFDITRDTKVNVKVYNLAGELIRAFWNAEGVGEIRWNLTEGVKVSSGMYVVVFDATTKTGMNKKVIKRFTITR